jgi:hypothetical protein
MPIRCPLAALGTIFKPDQHPVRSVCARKDRIWAPKEVISPNSSLTSASWPIPMPRWTVSRRAFWPSQLFESPTRCALGPFINPIDIECARWRTNFLHTVRLPVTSRSPVRRVWLLAACPTVSAW